ncbi:MAG: AAA family ATPase [Bacteroidota bacterium]|jgi:predicted ATPase
MFRLISLNINDWNYLGHIPANRLVFIPKEERKTTKLPYTSVIIGSNGTGKSTLLSYVARIFEDLKYFKENGNRNSNAVSFPYSICYQIQNQDYRVTQKQSGLDIDSFEKNDKRSLRWNYYVTINESETYLNLDKIELPEQIIAVSYLPMDRFRQKRNLPNDFYQYLGLRHRSNAASPQYFLNNTLPLLFNYISESKSIKFLKDILIFMDVDDTYLGIQLEYRYKKYFFTGDLSIKDFKNLFENPESYSKREGASFAVEYFKRYILEDERLIEKIVKYLNTKTIQDGIAVGEKSLLEFNLFENIEVIEELSLIQHLQKLDLLTSASLLFKKSAQNLINSQNLSSGEFHFLTTMIAIQASIKPNSLVLIDEPDTSLHPNWQMKYAHNLKELFKKWNSSHFILATHSHFIVSDLENKSSEVIGIKGKVPNIQVKAFNTATYGFSAEEILLDVFGVATTRNHYIYERIGEVLELIAMPNSDSSLITEKVVDLKNKGLDKLSKEDPLKEIIDKIIRKYASPK